MWEQFLKDGLKIGIDYSEEVDKMVSDHRLSTFYDAKEEADKDQTEDELLKLRFQNEIMGANMFDGPIRNTTLAINAIDMANK